MSEEKLSLTDDQITIDRRGTPQATRPGKPAANPGMSADTGPIPPQDDTDTVDDAADDTDTTDVDMPEPGDTTDTLDTTT